MENKAPKSWFLLGEIGQFKVGKNHRQTCYNMLYSSVSYVPLIIIIST